MRATVCGSHSRLGPRTAATCRRRFTSSTFPARPVSECRVTYRRVTASPVVIWQFPPRYVPPVTSNHRRGPCRDYTLTL